jgi:pimeloyl-ACP methyl ester carboxylesterase
LGDRRKLNLPGARISSHHGSMARRRAPSGPSTTSFPGAGVLKLLRGLLLVLAIFVVAIGGVSSFVAYKILSERNDAERISPDAIFQTSYENLSFKDKKGREHDGWLLVGLKGAPAIILCHGYASNRADLLVLGNLLQTNHFNAFIFNFQGPKVKDRFVDLGFTEVEVLQAALDKVTRHPGVNPNRVGLFGVNTGGFAAMALAQRSPRVKAVVVDTIYEDPHWMFDAHVDQVVGGAGDAFRIFPRTIFRLLTWGKQAPAIRDAWQNTAGMPKLFIEGRGAGLLAQQTEALYRAAPEPKRLLILDQSYPALASGTVKSEYEDQVLNFFLQNLPLRAD